MLSWRECFDDACDVGSTDWALGKTCSARGAGSKMTARNEDNLQKKNSVRAGYILDAAIEI